MTIGLTPAATATASASAPQPGSNSSSPTGNRASMFTAKNAAPAAIARDAARSRPKSKAGSLPTTTAWAWAHASMGTTVCPDDSRRSASSLVPRGMTRARPSRWRISSPTRSNAATTSNSLASIPIPVSRRARSDEPCRDELDAKTTRRPAPRSAATSSKAPGNKVGPAQIVPSRSNANPRILPSAGRAHLLRFPPLAPPLGLPSMPLPKPTRLRVYHLARFFPPIKPGPDFSRTGKPTPCSIRSPTSQATCSVHRVLSLAEEQL